MTFSVGVVEAGYIGLVVTGACPSHLGYPSRGVDKNEKHFRELRLGLIPFYESGLEDLVSRSVDQGRLSFAGLEGLAELVEEADVLFISVDTPQSGDGAADLFSVAAVARDIEAGHWRRRTGSACS